MGFLAHSDVLSDAGTSLKPELYSELTVGSRVMAILLNWWILPIGGVASEGSVPAACATGLFMFYNTQARVYVN